MVRFWDLVTLYPRISDRELEERLSVFIMEGDEEELLGMARELLEFASPLMLEDEGLRGLMASLEGKKLGLIIEGDYYSLVTFRRGGFEVELGSDETAPALIAADRGVYRDAVLKRGDPMRLFLERKIRVCGLPRMIRWVLPYIKVLRSRALYEKYLSRQAEIEARLEDALTRIGY